MGNRLNRKEEYEGERRREMIRKGEEWVDGC